MALDRLGYVVFISVAFFVTSTSACKTVLAFSFSDMSNSIPLVLCYSQTRGCTDPHCSSSTCEDGEVCHVTVVMYTTLSLTRRGCSTLPINANMSRTVCSQDNQGYTVCSFYCSQDICNKRRRSLVTSLDPSFIPGCSILALQETIRDGKRLV